MANESNQSVEQEAEIKTFTAEEHQAELTRVAAKEARKAEQGILKQLGLASKDELSAYLEKAKPKEEPPAQEAAKPTETPEYKQLLERLEKLEQTNTQAQAALTEQQQLAHLKAQKIPDEQLDFYHFKIAKLVTGDTTFEQAAAQYIKERPPQIKPPEFATGSGKPLASTTETEKIKADFAAAGKRRDSAEMSRLTRLAKDKGVSLT